MKITKAEEIRLKTDILASNLKESSKQRLYKILDSLNKVPYEKKPKNVGAMRKIETAIDDILR